jgi:hypothetical protein
MKLVNLRTERTHPRGKLDKPYPATFESLPKPVTMSQEIRTYAQLLQQIHGDLRIQHPEWVEPSGESPMCDAYEARLMELLDALT